MVNKLISIDKVKIGDRMVGAGEPCFIIAEAGVNHNGQFALAIKLVDAAVKARADAVKFQTFRSEDIITTGAAKASYQQKSTGTSESQLEMIKKLELGKVDFKKLYNYARKKGIMFLSTPFDKGSVDFLDKLGVPAFKIASGEITNFPLLEHIARKKKPVIMSTGMSTLKEIRDALEVLKKGGTWNIVLLHCVSSYPARIEDMNLKAIETLRHALKLPVGLSDHSNGITISIAATALGACIIEKHFTLDRNLPGPDHQASLEPVELAAMVQAVRDTAKAIGNGRRRLTAAERDIKTTARRSIVASQDIPSGTIITEDMLAIKRPGTGIEPKRLYSVIGKTAKNYIRRDELISVKKLL